MPCIIVEYIAIARQIKVVMSQMISGILLVFLFIFHIYSAP
mgnify:CR=1 FL=1